VRWDGAGVRQPAGECSQADGAKQTAQGRLFTSWSHRTWSRSPCRVLDTAVGIAPGDIAHFFDLFNRGMSPQGQGLGLGLTLAS
jgi:hypothetical protein